MSISNIQSNIQSTLNTLSLQDRRLIHIRCCFIAGNGYLDILVHNNPITRIFLTSDQVEFDTMIPLLYLYRYYGWYHNKYDWYNNNAVTQ